MTNEESEEILGYLFNQVNDTKYLYIHKWREYDALLWDNGGEI